MSMDVRAARGTPRYKRARRRFLAQNPLCAQCRADGITVAATELDHIKPAHTHPDLFWDRTNWQGLCRACHEAKTAAENRRYVDAGWLARLRELYGSD